MSPGLSTRTKGRDPVSVPQGANRLLEGVGWLEEGQLPFCAANARLGHPPGEICGLGHPQEGSAGMQGAGECLEGGGVHTETSTKQNPAAEDCGGPRLKSMDVTLTGEPSGLGSSGYLLGSGGHSHGLLEGRAGKVMRRMLLGVAMQEMGKWGAGGQAEPPVQILPCPGLTYKAWEVGGCTWTAQHLGEGCLLHLCKPGRQTGCIPRC